MAIKKLKIGDLLDVVPAMSALSGIKLRGTVALRFALLSVDINKIVVPFNDTYKKLEKQYKLPTKDPGVRRAFDDEISKLREEVISLEIPNIDVKSIVKNADGTEIYIESSILMSLIEFFNLESIEDD